MSKDQYVYPAVFIKEAGRLSITFPDLPDCSAEADTIEDGFARAKEALALFIYALEEQGKQPPEPSEIAAIHTDQEQFLTLIETWMPPFRKKMENQAVKKTLTIPKWLDDAAKEADLNYSRILQDALKEELNLDEGDRPFSVQDRLNKQLKKVKKSIKDLSKLRVHVNMINDDDHVKDESLSETVKTELEHVKQELNEAADRLKSSEEYQRLNAKINRIMDKLSR